MTLSEIKGEDAFDVLADILDPLSAISTDEEVSRVYKTETRLELVKLLLKKHKREVLEIMAALDRTPVDEYEVSLVTLPAKVLELINDPALKGFFPSPEQKETSSGSATENTEVAEK